MRYSRACDQSKRILSPSTSLKHKILILVTCYAENPNNWMLKELEAVLREVDNNLGFQRTTSAAIYAFLNLDGNLNNNSFLATNASTTNMLKEV